MKRTVFKENERAFFSCPCCGKQSTHSIYGLVAYEKLTWECSKCKTTFQLYINQIGKVFTEEENRVRYLGYTYKVL